MFADIAANVLTDGTQYGKFGSGHPDLVPYQAFRASDGWFIVACFTNAFCKRLAAALGRDDLLDDPRFRSNRDRVVRKQEFIPLLQAKLAEKPRAHWIALGDEVDVPACAVERLEDALESPQIKSQESVIEPSTRSSVASASSGRRSASARRRRASIGWRRCSAATRTRCCASFGVPDHEIDDLRAGGVIGG